MKNRNDLFETQHEILDEIEQIDALFEIIDKNEDGKRLDQHLNGIKESFRKIRDAVIQSESIQSAVDEHNLLLSREFVEDHEKVLANMNFLEKLDDDSELWIDNNDVMYKLEFGQIGDERYGVRVEYYNDTRAAMEEAS